MGEINLSEYIKKHPKISDTILIFSSNEDLKNPEQLKIFGTEKLSFIRGDYPLIKNFIEINKLIDFEIFQLSMNQSTDLLKLDNCYRVEPGAIIRELVTIEKDAVILMNATINIGAHIGEKTMIDMGAIIGSKAKIGKNCHVGANAVIAGVLEPESKSPVIIEDNVFIGANSVVLEGIKVGHDSIIGAMTLVNKDIPPYSLVIGVPCKIIDNVEKRVVDKCQNNPLLR